VRARVKGGQGVAGAPGLSECVCLCVRACVCARWCVGERECVCVCVCLRARERTLVHVAQPCCQRTMIITTLARLLAPHSQNPRGRVVANGEQSMSPTLRVRKKDPPARLGPPWLRLAVWPTGRLPRFSRSSRPRDECYIAGSTWRLKPCIIFTVAVSYNRPAPPPSPLPPTPQVPGVPIMYLAKHRYTIERLPEATVGGAPR
jgi:hypothetical protein